MTPPPLERRPDVDGLRAVAIALVIAYHAVPELLPGGFSGVDVFFVVSGYLISRILMADTGPGRWRRFYGRRVRRLFPALAVVLAATLLLGHELLLAEAFQRLVRHALAATLFVANLAFWREAGYFDADALEKPLLHLWSLGVEEQFYLAWPALLWWLLRRPRRALPATAAVALGSFAATVLVAAEAPSAVFYLPWFRFWELLAGALVAQVPALGVARQRSWPGALLAWTGLALIVGGGVLIDPAQPFPSWSALAPVAGTAALLWGGEHTWPGRVALGSRPAVALGLVSYPLYLWHWPLLAFQAELQPRAGTLERLAMLGVAVLLATATYLAVERPAQRLYRRLPAATTAVLAGALAGLAAASWLLRDATPPRSLEPTPIVAYLEEQRRLDAELRQRVATRPCEAPPALAAVVERGCEVSGPREGRPIVLWGDSTADSWAPLVRAVAAERGRPAVVLSVSGCPPLLGVRGPFHDGCGVAEAAARLEWIAALQPTHIVLTARWSAYTNEARAGERSAPHYVTLAADGTATAATSREAVAAQLPATLRRLDGIAPVVFVAAPPDLLLSPLRALPHAAEYRPTVDEHRRAQELTSALVAQARREGLRVAVVDPGVRLCAGGRCEALLEGELVYQDDNHVTAQGALLFRGELAAALARLGG